MNSRRALFYVQHLLGTGHLQRVAILARTLAAAGVEADVVSGGMPVADLDIGSARLLQLSPARARGGGDWSLVDAAGAPVDEEWRKRRRTSLLEILRDRRPGTVIVEMFPFGRRQNRFEILPLLEALSAQSPRPLRLCSIRDILQTGGKPERAAQAAKIVENHFDFVMIHGDPNVVPFDASFPAADRIREKLVYTGYVSALTGGAEPDPVQKSTAAGDVLVSAGGGAVGATLFATALQAREKTSVSQSTWRLLAGPNLADHDFQALARHAGPGIVVERARQDFRDLLTNCAVSISQAGYNTLVDVVAAAAPSVVVPYAQEGETEQTMRAQRFSELGLVHTVAESELSAATLASAVDAAVGKGRPDTTKLDLSGAETSARLISGWLAERAAV